MKRNILLALALAAAGCSSSVSSVPALKSSGELPTIRHIVIMVQENRSFDNLFAGFPGANAATAGFCKPDLPTTTWCKVARRIALRPIKLEDGHVPGGHDICHSHQCFELECDPDSLNVCRNDGFDLITNGETYQPPQWAKLYPYSYVERSETKPYWNLAGRYTLADDAFSTDTASSFVAHQELIAGTVRLNDDESLTDEPDTTPWGCDAPPGTQTALIFRDGRVFDPPRARKEGPPYLPFPCFTQYRTMADLFDAAGTSWKFYVWWMSGAHADFSGDIWNGFDAIKRVACPSLHKDASGVRVCTRGKDWSHMSFPTTSIFTDLKRHALPEVSWVIPTLCDSDHPGSGANRGPRWVTEVVNAIGTSEYWKSTAIILLWDDWGGWYDNVPPPQTSYTSLGFRVPMIVISPWAKSHYVSHTQYDFGSILKFTEQNFGLGSLGVSDVTANSISDVFDFMQRPTRFEAAPLPHVASCPKISSGEFVQENGAPPG